MTKEEYEKLLQSDYWKGYSYSIIKERNFTCQDCGRSFPNERNMLQVHHLVYRDIKPWSYNPEELVVLCVSCHKKRHGILSDQEQPAQSPSAEAPMQESTHRNESQTQIGTNYNKSEKNGYIGADIHKKYTFSTRNKNLHKIVLIVSALVLLYISNKIIDVNRETRQQESNKEQETTKIIRDNTSKSLIADKKNNNNNLQYNNRKINSRINNNADYFEEEENLRENTINTNSKERDYNNLSTLDILERDNHTSVVKMAEEAGVSTEGSTTDILERINHADAIKMAKEMK